MPLVVGQGLLIALIVLVSAGLFVAGLVTDAKLLIGAGFLLLALCSIFGAQPGWPKLRR
jgi:hypothetical protein